MPWNPPLSRIAAERERNVRDVFLGVTSEVERSVVEGSELTGAPGQPVDTGTLRASWAGTFASPSRWSLSTNIEYAPVIEDNARGATLRSAVGGFHSVKKTVLGFPNIVTAVFNKVFGR